MDERVKYIISGFGAGILSGLLGLGGGIIFVPLLVAYFGLTQHMAQATSMLAIIPTATASATIYWLHGSVDPEISLYIIIGSVIGANIGARFMKRMPEKVLKQAFALFIVFVGIRMVIG